MRYKDEDIQENPTTTSKEIGKMKIKYRQREEHDMDAISGVFAKFMLKRFTKQSISSGCYAHYTHSQTERKEENEQERKKKRNGERAHHTHTHSNIHKQTSCRVIDRHIREHNTTESSSIINTIAKSAFGMNDWKRQVFKIVNHGW